MTSLFLKVALAAVLTAASIVGLIGVSGLIIFADLKPLESRAIMQSQKLPAAPGPLTFSGPNQ